MLRLKNFPTILDGLIHYSFGQEAGVKKEETGYGGGGRVLLISFYLEHRSMDAQAFTPHTNQWDPNYNTVAFTAVALHVITY